MKPIKFNNNNHLPKEALILYKPKQKNNDMKSAEERLTKGMKKFANCTDYDDAVKAINEAVAETRSEMMEFAEWLLLYPEQVLDKTCGEMMWEVTVETHVIEHMTTKQAFAYWLTNIKGK